jgi:Ca2+-binding EF-hand superfamily protein
VFDRYLTIAAAALGAAAPGFAAAAQTARPGATPATSAPQVAPTRAAMLKNLDTTFKSLDTNGDGTLSQAEVAVAETKGVQVRIQQMRTQAEGQFNKLDTNRDGQLSKVEFMAAAPQFPPAANGANVLAALDKNKDGKLTLDEYRTPMVTRFERLDLNKDGIISAPEQQAARTAQAATKK